MTAPAKAAVQVGRTAREVQEEMVADIRRWCLDHVAQVGEGTSVIVFRKPGTSVYSMTFRIQGRYLIVTGDVGEAIYEWSSPITWTFLAGCGFGYLQGKCQAHRNGYRARGWDGDVAAHRLAEHLLEFEADCTDDLREHGVSEVLRSRVLPDEPWLQPTEGPDLDSRETWLEWLREFGYESLGDAWWEWAPSVGEVPDTWMLAHWVGLKLALEQVGEQAIQERQP